MDRSNVEPGSGLRDGVAGLHELLCRADGGAARSNGYGKIRRDHAEIWSPRGLDRTCQFRRILFEAPLKWRKPLRIFVNSMSDLFQDSVPERLISGVWQVMEKAHWHSFQILTKRPERMREVLRGSSYPILRNVWLGTSVESQDYADRIKLLRETPAHIRFVSFEPLIGPIIAVHLSGVHWAIVGGESGPSARPMETWWVEELRDTCREQGVAFFFKQWGGVRKGRTGRTFEGRTWDEYPAAAAG